MLILVAQMYGLIPEEYPFVCECGFLLETNIAGTSIKCQNPSCPLHSSLYIPEMLSILDIKASIGPERALDIIMQLDLKSHLDLFAVSEKMLLDVDSSLVLPIKRIQLQLKMINDSGGITLAKYVSLWNFKNIGDTRSKDLFAKFSSLDDFYENFTDKYTAKKFIGDCLKTSPFTDTVHSIYNTLIASKSELFRCMKYFKIKEVGKDVLHVAITLDIDLVLDDKGNAFKPREKFIDYLSKRFNMNIVFDKQFSSKTDFLICDSVADTGKIKRARKISRGDVYVERDISKGIEIGSRVINSKELVDLLERNRQ